MRRVSFGVEGQIERKRRRKPHHERCRTAIRDVPSDRVVNRRREESNVVLKITRSGQERARLVLEDPDFGGLVHLTGSVEETVAGDTGVRVDEAVRKREEGG